MKGTELEKIHQQADEAISAEMAARQNVDALNDLFYRLGGLDVLQTVANNLNAALIRNLQVIRDDRLYLAAGFQRFDDFMDNHPRSKMSYKRFNYIEGIYNNLGPETFDLMSGSGLSMRQMKALGRGNVEVDGDHIVVTSDDGQTEAIEIANRRQWLDAVTTLAKAKSDSDEKVRRQQKTIESQEQTIQNAHDDLDRERARKYAEAGQDPHSVALANACFALAALREAAGELSPVDRSARRDNVLETLAGQLEKLRAAYRSEGTERPSAELEYSIDYSGEGPQDPDEAWAHEFVANLPPEPGDGDNEGELAAQL